MEDFLARSNTGRCQDFRETADVIAKVNALQCVAVLKHVHVHLRKCRGILLEGFQGA